VTSITGFLPPQPLSSTGQVHRRFGILTVPQDPLQLPKEFQLMSVDAIAQHFRGVHCRRCGKPVRVPALVIKKESASHLEHDANDTQYHLISKVFVLRCHSCCKESVYAINQIVDFSFVPQVLPGMAEEAIA
jgi:hypothetical protein